MNGILRPNCLLVVRFGLLLTMKRSLTMSATHLQRQILPRMTRLAPNKARKLPTSHLTLPIARPFVSFVPVQAAIHLDEPARTFLKGMLQKAPRPEIVGVLLTYQSSSTSLGMAFHFAYCTAKDISDQDEAVSLEIMMNGKPKSPRDAVDDGLFKLYVAQGALIKVLGSTLQLNGGNNTLVLVDAQGNPLDPNA